jgi:hypothetical protein
MIRTIVAANFAVLLAFGSSFAPVAVSANPVGGHSASSKGHVAPFRHRAHRYFPYAPYYYGYDYGADYGAPPLPPAKPVAEKPVTENRRGCESQTYMVPSSEGGESQVMILRC